ncbi:conserved membrane hypothetical protein [Hyella patelloides LEGE 07179]|uniref:DUF2232 domain-containing protein n=1 Tax=Hyella patelloides LEGE 07179 TaxID=945734 RepID=A0A563VPC8_9CYAN|nr:DUF2232 domain-containing protein [Hyella patelloides]VEP13261.1 conserved membrane hypothetical protein [Hyella patelloides LEGE 07179]
MSNQESEDRNEPSIFLDTVNNSNWVDGDDPKFAVSSQLPSVTSRKKSPVNKTKTVVMVETAFLASAASLIWLINYYFPLGPLLKLFFPIPTALVYLRRGSRAAWMSALVAMLLLSVLMGPTRSIVFLMPYGLMGIQLGACWQRKTNWLLSITLGSLIGSIGLFFRFWLFSILLGEDLWVYVITQITQLTDWLFLKLGILAQPDFFLIQVLALIMILINNLIYLFAVHLVALILLDRLGNPIARPPQWVRTLLDY